MTRRLPQSDMSAIRLAQSSARGTGSADPLIDPIKLFKIVKRQWWIIALSVLLCGLIAFFLLRGATPIYQANAILEVEQKERTILDVSSVENIDADAEFLTTQIELLKSRALAEVVIQELDLLNDPYFYAAPEDEPERPYDERLTLATNAFLSSLSVDLVGRSRLIRLRFRHPDRRKAARAVNMIADRFIGVEVDSKIASSTFATDFLETRLQQVQESLNAAERALVDYATENDLILTQGGDSFDATGALDTDVLIRLNQDLADAESAVIAARVSYEQSQQNTYSADLIDNDAISRLRGEKVKLESEYQEKLSVFKPSFPEMVELKNRIDLFADQIASEENRLIQGRRDVAQYEYEAARARRNNLAARVNERKSSVTDVREKSIDYGILLRQVETERAQYQALLQRFKEVSVSDEINESLVSVVDRAQAPLQPISPNKPRTMILAVLFGGLLGFAIAYLRDMIDNRIRAIADVREELGETLIGVIPESEDMDREVSDQAGLLSDSQSSISEAYASLRTNLRFSAENGGPRVLQVTSTRASEGKSTTSLGLALRIADVGDRVLLIDGDMRRPTFKVNRQAGKGLAELIAGQSTLAEHVSKTEYENLDLLASGSQVVNPSELLSGKRFDRLIAEAREAYDYVIVDSPPLLGLADAVVLANKVDATVVVVESGKLKTRHVEETLLRLREGGGNVIGIVLTKVRQSVTSDYDYYRYNYENQKTSRMPSMPGKAKEPKSKTRVVLG